MSTGEYRSLHLTRYELASSPRFNSSSPAAAEPASGPGRWQRESYSQCFIQLFFFRLAQLTNVIRQACFLQAHQTVTMDSAVVFPTFFGPHIDLRRQPMSFCKDGSTNDCRVVGINDRLPTDDHE